jgi:hypothetical protein
MHIILSKCQTTKPASWRQAPAPSGVLLVRKPVPVAAWLHPSCGPVSCSPSSSRTPCTAANSRCNGARAANQGCLVPWRWRGATITTASLCDAAAPPAFVVGMRSYVAVMWPFGVCGHWLPTDCLAGHVVTSVCPRRMCWHGGAHRAAWCPATLVHTARQPPGLGEMMTHDCNAAPPTLQAPCRPPGHRWQRWRCWPWTQMLSQV